MARTIKLYAQSGSTTLTVSLYNDSDALVETIALTEAANAKGVYRGTVTGPAGTYDAVVLDAATPIGAFGYVRVLGVDPEVVKVGDAQGVPDAVKLGVQVSRTNQAGDSLTETITEN